MTSRRSSTTCASSCSAAGASAAHARARALRLHLRGHQQSELRALLVAARASAAAEDARCAAHRRADEPLRTAYADTAMLGAHARPARKPDHPRQRIRQLRARACGARGDAGSAVAVLGKWNGAVGNFNAHVSARSGARLAGRQPRASSSRSALSTTRYTTQIEPHDWIAEYCDALAAVNVILIDLCRDLWGYISLGYLRQRAVAGEVGSSTMPHKVNPIDFENAEGNFGVANALLRHFADKLPISRWQRDLTDSTVLRNLGVALGAHAHRLERLGRGLAKIEADPARMAPTSTPPGRCWRRRCRPCCAPPACPTATSCLKELHARPRDRCAGSQASSTRCRCREPRRQRLRALTPAGLHRACRNDSPAASRPALSQCRRARQARSTCLMSREALRSANCAALLLTAAALRRQNVTGSATDSAPCLTKIARACS